VRHWPLIVPIVLLLAPLRAEEKPPPVKVERVREILQQARPHLVRLTGLEWPEGLAAEKTDLAGLTALLESEFLGEIAALRPERSPASRRHLARVLATSFARVVRAKYGLETKKIHVAEGALERLPEGAKPDRVLVSLVTHEAVHALDDRAADLGRLIAETRGGEALRALRMVIEGRAEHYGAAAAALLGVPEEVGEALARGRDLGERLTREAGRRFVASLEKRDGALPLKALREPPRSTSVVFHPERYPTSPETPDLEKPLAAAGVAGAVSGLSELLLRKRFLERLDREAVERAFSGYLAGASRATADGRRVSLVALVDGAAAVRFLAGIRAFEGVEAGRAIAELRTPDGRRFKWAALTRGRFVAEALVPADEDPEAPAKRVLSAAAPKTNTSGSDPE
jgi:hypothetical protein